MDETFINRVVQFPIDGYEGMGKVFETYVKDLALTAIQKGGFDTRGILSETFECSVKILKESMEMFGRVYSSGPGIFLVIEDKYLLRSDVIRDEGAMRFRIWALSTKEHLPDLLARVKGALHPYIYNKMGLDVTWAFAKQAKIDYIDLQSELDDVIYQEAYPYIDELDKWVARYLASKASVLLLIGSPGTGKTRLIKYILKAMGTRKSTRFDSELGEDDNTGTPTIERFIKNPYILYSMDEKVFTEDNFFIKFFSETYDAIVLEDVDLNLKSRKAGNYFMAKLLGGSDGLLSGTKRKIILSTNLKHISDIDEALLRPGRCFGTIHTRELDLTEAEILAKILNKDILALRALEKKEFTLAEIYNM